MKRRICLALLLSLLLCACGGKPAETTAPPESAAPAGTTVPPQTTLPPETTAPAAAFESYTVKLTQEDTPIYAGPAFRYGTAELIYEPGVFTIVEEATDADGNLWGKLKSGAGWLCLTEPALAPIHADYAEESFNGYHAYWSGDTDYITSIGFTANETLTDVSFTLLDWFERGEYQVHEELFTIETMTPEQPFLAQVTFWGDMTTYGISFTDESGELRCYYLMISGKDGSLICAEYEP
jgi:hypothetical protein